MTVSIVDQSEEASRGRSGKSGKGPKTENMIADGSGGRETFFVRLLSPEESKKCSTT